MDTQKTPQAQSEVQPLLQYEAPRIETVLTPEELEREVLYAGQNSRVS
jgi:hypothetical protein